MKKFLGIIGALFLSFVSPALAQNPGILYNPNTGTLGDILVYVDQYHAKSSGVQVPATFVTSWNTRFGAVVPASGDYTVSQVTGAAPLASPAFTGTPTVPTQATADNSTTAVNSAWVRLQAYLTGNQSITLTSDCSGSGATSIAAICTKTNGVAFAASATTDATNASNISTGTLAATRGGTGNVLYAVGDILYANTTTTLTKLSAGAVGTSLKANGAGVAPSFRQTSSVAKVHRNGTQLVYTPPASNTYFLWTPTTIEFNQDTIWTTVGGANIGSAFLIPANVRSVQLTASIHTTVGAGGGAANYVVKVGKNCTATAAGFEATCTGLPGCYGVGAAPAATGIVSMNMTCEDIPVQGDYYNTFIYVDTTANGSVAVAIDGNQFHVASQIRVFYN